MTISSIAKVAQRFMEADPRFQNWYNSDETAKVIKGLIERAKEMFPHPAALWGEKYSVLKKAHPIVETDKEIRLITGIIVKRIYDGFTWLCCAPEEEEVRQFIHACLEDGLGIEDKEEKEKYAMAVGMSIAKKLYDERIGQKLKQFVDEESNHDLGNIALSLVRWDRVYGRKPDAQFEEYYHTLVEKYNRVMRKIETFYNGTIENILEIEEK